MGRKIDLKPRNKQIHTRAIPSQKRPIALICAVLALLTLAVYWRLQQNDFINFDDNVYITENPAVLGGLTWPDVKWAFTTGYTGYPHPLTWLTHQLDYQFYRNWAGGHHLTSVAIHVANTVLLLLFLWRTSGFVWRSAFVAAVFALHPLHVESVAWIAERKDVLCGFFFFLTLHAYVSYVKERSPLYYLLALLCFVAGLLSKPMIVTLPFVLLLMDIWPLRRLLLGANKRNSAPSVTVLALIVEKIPFFVLAILWSVVTLIVQKQGGGLARIETVDTGTRIANAIVSYAFYIWKTFAPQNLALFYPYSRQLPWSAVLASIALLVLISVFCFYRRNTSPFLLVGWLWFLGMLTPVIGLLQAGAQARADRYTYLPQTGLIFAFTWAISDLAKSWPRQRALLAGTAAIALSLLAWRTWERTSIWHDSESVWRNALAATTANYTAHVQLCDALLKKGRIDEAIAEAEMSLQIHPNGAEGHSNLAIALSRKGDMENALAHLQRAVELKPNRPKLHYNIATALAEKGRLDEAISHYEQEIQIQPEFAEAHNNLGTALLRKGRLDDALDHFEKAIAANPRLAKAYYNAGIVLVAKNRPSEAVDLLQQALQVNPTDADARIELGVAWSQAGRVDLAISAWEKALESDPDNLSAAYDLAWVSATFPDEAIRDGKKAVRLAEHVQELSGKKDPRNYRLLAAAYAENHQFDKAIDTAQRGLELATDQGNYPAANVLNSNIDLYRRNIPLRDPSE
ncbi:MAG TPA: tetratricopeptide repeat protein [Candidatus Udaeobacter sp.]|nr:tetratricopeptide repeat protein [Candidatus Udaeobacter sp.]